MKQEINDNHNVKYFTPTQIPLINKLPVLLRGHTLLKKSVKDEQQKQINNIPMKQMHPNMMPMNVPIDIPPLSSILKKRKQFLKHITTKEFCTKFGFISVYNTYILYLSLST